MTIETLWEVWRVTKRSEKGEVLETEYMEDRWTPLGLGGRPDGDPDLMWVSKSTSYEGRTIRKKAE